MTSFRIIMSGAPGAGKSIFTENINNREFTWKGQVYTFRTIPEQASVLLIKAPNLIVNDPHSFAKNVLLLQIEAEEQMQSTYTQDSQTFVLDRCMWDCKLFNSKSMWSSITEDLR